MIKTQDSTLYCIDRYWVLLDKLFIFKNKIGFQKPSRSKITGKLNIELDQSYIVLILNDPTTQTRLRLSPYDPYPPWNQRFLQQWAPSPAHIFANIGRIFCQNNHTHFYHHLLDFLTMNYSKSLQFRFAFVYNIEIDSSLKIFGNNIESNFLIFTFSD